MKSFVVLCVALVAGIHAANVVLPPMQLAKTQKAAAECMKESGVSYEVLFEAKESGNFEDESLKKYVFCFFKKTGFIDSDGKLKVDEVIEKLLPGVNKKELESCVAKTKSGSLAELMKTYPSPRRSEKTQTKWSTKTKESNLVN